MSKPLLVGRRFRGRGIDDLMLYALAVEQVPDEIIILRDTIATVEAGRPGHIWERHRDVTRISVFQVDYQLDRMIERP
jgi:hypothetical protein